MSSLLVSRVATAFLKLECKKVCLQFVPPSKGFFVLKRVTSDKQINTAGPHRVRPIFNPLARCLPAQLCNDVITLPKAVTWVEERKRSHSPTVIVTAYFRRLYLYTTKYTLHTSYDSCLAYIYRGKLLSAPIATLGSNLWRLLMTHSHHSHHQCRIAASQCNPVQVARALSELRQPACQQRSPAQVQVLYRFTWKLLEFNESPPAAKISTAWKLRLLDS